MARPAMPAATDELYAGLGPWTDGDNDADRWYLLHWAHALAGQFLAEDDTLIRDSDEGPGWSALLDINRAPADALDYLGMFRGVEPLFGLDEASQRIRVQSVSGSKRGTLESIRGAAQQYLTGTRRVEVYEREGSAYHFRVVTYVSETPDSARVLAALQAQKPAGLTMTYEVQAGVSWDQLVGTWDAQPGTWDGFSDLIPGGP